MLCDIGNSSYHFFDGKSEFKRDVESLDPSSMREHIYYISVNHSINQKLEHLPNWIDLSCYIDKTEYYESMGIDRIVACMGVEYGVVVDAGSAITVDIIKESKFTGGFIYPGIKTMLDAYSSISPALSCSFNFELPLDTIPKNTIDALSYGALGLLVKEINSYSMRVILTGGDAPKLSTMINNATIDTELIFKGMKKLMREAKIC